VSVFSCGLEKKPSQNNGKIPGMALGLQVEKEIGHVHHVLRDSRMVISNETTKQEFTLLNHSAHRKEIALSSGRIAPKRCINVKSREEIKIVENPQTKRESDKVGERSGITTREHDVPNRCHMGGQKGSHAFVEILMPIEKGKASRPISNPLSDFFISEFRPRNCV
jgi:hypothetical protein